MAGRLPDLEKQGAITPAENSPRHDISSSTRHSLPVIKEEHIDDRHSLATTTSRAHSHSSVDTDPLSPLEHALGRPLSIAADIEPTPPSDADKDDQDGTNSPPAHHLTHTATRTSMISSASRPPDFELTLDADDPENPRNWCVDLPTYLPTYSFQSSPVQPSHKHNETNTKEKRPLWYRAYTVLAVSYATWVVVLYSTSYTATIPGVMDEFAVSSRPVATLGLTTYLLGLAAGSVVVAPMSGMLFLSLSLSLSVCVGGGGVMVLFVVFFLVVWSGVVVSPFLPILWPDCLYPLLVGEHMVVRHGVS
jgi:hypothetical protein